MRDPSKIKKMKIDRPKTSSTKVETEKTDTPVSGKNSVRRLKKEVRLGNKLIKGIEKLKPDNWTS